MNQFAAPETSFEPQRWKKPKPAVWRGNLIPESFLKRLKKSTYSVHEIAKVLETQSCVWMYQQVKKWNVKYVEKGKRKLYYTDEFIAALVENNRIRYGV